MRWFKPGTVMAIGGDLTLRCTDDARMTGRGPPGRGARGLDKLEHLLPHALAASVAISVGVPDHLGVRAHLEPVEDNPGRLGHRRLVGWFGHHGGLLVYVVNLVCEPRRHPRSRLHDNFCR